MHNFESSHEINTALIQFEVWLDEHSEGDIEEFISDCKIDTKIAEGLRRTMEFETRLRELSSNNQGNDKFVNAMSGQVFDNYRFVRRLGVGGMGTVWLAEQLMPVHREVAIKLIRPGLDSDHFKKRFEAEQQALAMMSHPHVAKVLDAGRLEDGRPYFVMDFVPGLPINEYCDINKFSLKARLEVFLQLCDAIQHAHQKGLLHRDIKPTNVLITEVDGKPHVKVIDFGLVKDSSHDAQLTQIAMPIGSPIWMSPEQALGKQEDVDDIDTRTDIYSLGVILYQLLTNSTPISEDFFSTAGPLEILEAIQELDTPYPSVRLSKLENSGEWMGASTTSNQSAWLQMLRNDLDWVTMKAIEKDRDRRYVTVSALADDIKRFLDDEPVIARPPTFSYRIKKLIKKHRVPAIATIAIAASLLIATLVSIAFAYWATQERETAELERRRQERVVDVFIGGLGKLNERGSSHSIETRNYLLALIEQTNQEDFSNDPLTEASLRFTIGKGLARSGMDDYAVSEFEKVIDINSNNPSSEVEITASAGIMLSLARSRMELTELGEIVAHQSVLLAQEWLPVDHELHIKALVALNTAKVQAKKYEEALPALAHLHTYVQERFGKTHPIMIDIKTQLADAKAGVNEYATAAWYLDEARELTILNFGKDSPRGRELFVNKWEANARNLELDKVPEELLRFLESTLTEHPAGHPVNLSLRDRCGDILLLSNQPEQALEVYENNLVVFREIRGKHHQNTANGLRKIAFSNAHLGHFSLAFDFLMQANEITEKNYGSDSHETLWGQYDLALIHFMKSDLKETKRINDAILASSTLLKDSRLRYKSELLKVDCETASSRMGTAVNMFQSLLNNFSIPDKTTGQE